MKNILYFAVDGTEAAKPVSDCAFAYGGFGFTADGAIRQPYALPPDAIVLFDDRTVPKTIRPEILHDFIRANRIETLIFDFEQAKTERLCHLVQSVKEIPTVVSPAYAALCSSAVLLPPYHPREPFSGFLQRRAQQHRKFMMDCSPVGAVLCGGRWENEHVRRSGGCFAAKQQCMYRTAQTKSGMKLHFYDTRKTLLARAAAARMPCIVPLSEFLSLSEE